MLDERGAVSAPTFSIVVPTFRRPDALQQTLTALLALDYPPGRYEVIVVDGADEVTAARVVGRLADRGIAVKLETQYQRGAAFARNYGARIAGGELLLFCDDDIVVTPPHLLAHLAAHERHRDAVVAGTWELPPAAIAALQTTPFGRYRIELERRFLEEANARRGPRTGSGLRGRSRA
jgi:glycosyltransferase involved in cell wall biosynthesis